MCKKIEVACSLCRKPFYKYPSQIRSKKIFCSNECRYKTIHTNASKKKINLSCVHCDKEYERIPSRSLNSSYCSKECQYKAMGNGAYGWFKSDPEKFW